MLTNVPPAIGPCEGERLSIRGCCATAAAQTRAAAKAIWIDRVKQRVARIPSFRCDRRNAMRNREEVVDQLVLRVLGTTQRGTCASCEGFRHRPVMRTIRGVISRIRAFCGAAADARIAGQVRSEPRTAVIVPSRCMMLRVRNQRPWLSLFSRARRKAEAHDFCLCPLKPVAPSA